MVAGLARFAHRAVSTGQRVADTGAGAFMG